MYARYMFNLQCENNRIVSAQRTCTHLNEYESLYCHLSEVERELSQTHAQLQEARDEIDTRTQAIVHLEHVVEQQDAELKEIKEHIVDLLQQVHELQIQLPPAPEDPEEG
jgi:chromosome segregation ATPase